MRFFFFIFLVFMPFAALATDNCDALPVRISGGEFLMGDDNVFFRNSSPSHLVRVDSFILDDREVTAGNFLRFLELPKARNSMEEPCFPARGINMREAESYCNAKGGRLPTEEEWEYAATVDMDTGKKYPWSSGDLLPPVVNSITYNPLSNSDEEELKLEDMEKLPSGEINLDEIEEEFSGEINLDEIEEELSGEISLDEIEGELSDGINLDEIEGELSDGINLDEIEKSSVVETEEKHSGVIDSTDHIAGKKPHELLVSELVESDKAYKGLNGLRGMLGNLWEWTSNPYLPYGNRNTSPVITSEGTLYTIRGGSFQNTKIPELMKGTVRNKLAGNAPQTASFYQVGFRCAYDSEL